MQHVANVTRLRDEPDEVAIEVTDLSHIYAGPEGGVAALEDVSISVGTGHFVVIVGPSGCGKTSLLMMLAGCGTRAKARSSARGGRWRTLTLLASASSFRRRACFRG